MKLVWPLRKRFPVLQSNLFGANPQNYSRFNLGGHDGIDIMCPAGEDVAAPIDGKVYVGWDAKGWGLYIRITNGDGEVILAHLKDNLVSTGTTVTQGMLIAHSDNTGNSSNPHLHLGLKVKGVSNPAMKNFVDPLLYLEKEGGDMDAEIIKRADAFVAVATTLGKPVDKDIVLADLKRLIELEDKLRERDEELEKKRQEIEKLSLKMQEFTNDKKILENENEEQQRRLSDLTREFVDVQKQLEELQKIKPMTDYSILELILKIVKKIFGKGG